MSLKRILFISAVALVGALSLGAAANIVVDGGNVGAGDGSVGGYTTSNTTWSLDSSGLVDGVDFDISPAPTSVDVTTDAAGDSFANWTCVAAAATSCTATAPVDPADITSLSVVASS